MAETFTRVTVAGPQRHVDVLLPSQTPAGLLLPQILELLDDQPTAAVSVKTLITPAGDPVREDASLSDAGIADGAMLRLVNVSEAPPAPVVYDITDAVVEQTEDIGGRWTEKVRRATGAVFAAAGLYLGVHLEQPPSRRRTAAAATRRRPPPPPPPATQRKRHQPRRPRPPPNGPRTGFFFFSLTRRVL